MKPSSTLTRLNRLAEEIMETAFATVVYAVVDPDARVCRYSSAGHPPPLVLFPDRRIEFLEGDEVCHSAPAPKRDTRRRSWSSRSGRRSSSIRTASWSDVANRST